MTAVAPHPPLLIPQVGKKDIERAMNTKEALTRLGRDLVEAEPEVVVVISPHGPVFQDGIVINSAPTVAGDFGGFGAPQERLQFITDGLFAGAIQDEAEPLGVQIVPLTLDIVRSYGLTTALDHGAMVPLYYLKKAGFSGKVVSVTMGILPLAKLYAFGLAIQRAAENLGRRAAVIASGDLSHRLSAEAPNGFNPRGKEFDAVITRFLERGDVEGLLTIPRDLREEAGECGYRPIVMMAGAVDGYILEPKFYSYEGPFGVGYTVAAWRPIQKDESHRLLAKLVARSREGLAEIRKKESPIVRLARQTAEYYVNEGQVPTEWNDLPAELPEQAGVFVTVHKDGNLRGCIGTFVPTRPTLAEEVVYNAVQSVSADPRFDPVAPEELAELEYSVDLLGEPRVVTDLTGHDPKVHGIIVAKGERRGLLLPDLDGIDTTSQQVELAKKKAGIGVDDEDVTLAEFEVTRYK